MIAFRCWGIQKVQLGRMKPGAIPSRPCIRHTFVVIHAYFIIIVFVAIRDPDVAYTDHVRTDENSDQEFSYALAVSPDHCCLQSELFNPYQTELLCLSHCTLAMSEETGVKNRSSPLFIELNRAQNHHLGTFQSPSSLLRPNHFFQDGYRYGTAFVSSSSSRPRR